MRTLAIPRPAGSAPGFTLFALIATLFCVAVGICAVAFLLPHRGNSAARASTRAGALASETAEELLGAPDGAGELAAGLHSDPANPRDGIFDVRWSVTDATHLKRITVTVTRRGQGKAPDAQVLVERPDSPG